ncbi:MAG TPA: hypothetical protein VEU62_00050 [Bryobacterales bacterium]|nr:hypothetical protein [Bryobacterales bacterium]
MRKYCLVALLALVPAWGQAPETFHGRKAWKLESDRLRVTVLEGGGHIAELVLKNPPGGQEVNPLWIPPWPSIEPSTYSKDKYGKAYGTDSEAATLAGIMGHNVAFDYWGAPSPSEFRAGLSYHGEVSTLAWYPVVSRSTGGALDFTYRADLPESRTSLTRRLRLRPGQPVLYFEETAENHTPFDLPFGWVEHVTFGPPFVDAGNSAFDASATRGERGIGDRSHEFQWPADGSRDFRRFSQDARSADMVYALLDPGREVEFIAAVNTQYREVAAYIFKRADFAWLNLWEQNRSITTPPWNGETRTRGMEFGNTRVSGTARAYFKMPSFWDTPAFGWLDAQGKHTARYMAVVAPVPEGFEGVRDIMIAGNEIVIVGRPRENQTIRIPFDPSLF